MSKNSFIQIFLKALAFLGIIAVLVLLDQWTKQLAVTYLKDSRPFVIWEGVLELSYLENQGAAFGSLQGQRTVFLIITPIICIVLFYLSLRYSGMKKMIPLVACFIMIIGGAIGNFIDRFRLSYVIDFIYFKIIDFPVFNVADIFVTCSSFLMVFLILFKYKDEDFGTVIPIRKK